MTNSKPVPATKRANLPREVAHDAAFQKDWARHQKAGRTNLAKAKEAMLLLIANDRPLPPEWRDHALQGEWADHRELHFGGDALLIYTADATRVTFVRLGTHSELFGR